ncbi:hypothetical protein [Gaiella occulta]|nr:hypothetical protein [Gaiella occulta]
MRPTLAAELVLCSFSVEPAEERALRPAVLGDRVDGSRPAP